MLQHPFELTYLERMGNIFTNFVCCYCKKYKKYQTTSIGCKGPLVVQQNQTQKKNILKYDQSGEVYLSLFPAMNVCECEADCLCSKQIVLSQG